MKFFESYRIYPYLTEDEMNVHQGELTTDLTKRGIRCEEMFGGPKEDCKFSVSNLGVGMKEANFLVILKVWE